MLTADQLRAARAMLNWGQEQLARESGISRPTIKRMEGPMGPARSSVSTHAAVREALESAGIEFLGEDEVSGPGVRRRKSSAVLLDRQADAINRVVRFRIAFEKRDYDCVLRSTVLDRLDRRVPGYATAAEIEAAFDRYADLVTDHARKVVAEGLARDGALTLWPEDFAAAG
jgi:predicted transcriptional regulator